MERVPDRCCSCTQSADTAGLPDVVPSLSLNLVAESEVNLWNHLRSRQGRLFFLCSLSCHSVLLNADTFSVGPTECCGCSHHPMLSTCHGTDLQHFDSIPTRIVCIHTHCQGMQNVMYNWDSICQRVHTQLYPDLSVAAKGS